MCPVHFISLLENAFKHGISPTLPSFIHLRLTADEQHICCDIQNSYHPKNENDRSGHGIGLQQVQQRLDLAYPGRYTWQRGVSDDGKVDYLLKPVAYDDFLKAASKALDWFSMSIKQQTYAEDRFMFVKSDYKLIRAPNSCAPTAPTSST